MNSLGSLAQLHAEAENVFGQRLLLPVDEQFVHSLHCPSSTAAQCAGNSVFSGLYNGLLQRTRCRDSGASPGIPRLLFSYVAEAVAASRNGEFMGPLCSPLRKSHAAMLRSNEYFLTEKSDGTRAILVSLCVQAFPCWVLRGADGCSRSSLRLDDVAALEDMRQQFCRGATPLSGGRPLQLSPGAFSVEGERTISPDGEVETFTLKPCPAPPSAAACGTNSVTAERKWGARHMAYCFDRSMEQAYLLLEEYAVPSLSAFAVDGEMMIAVTDVGENGTRPIFGCFDVFRYTQAKDAVDRDALLTRWPMSKRYEALRELIIAPMHASENARSPAPFLHFFAKEMFPINKFGECLSRLRRAATGEGTGGVEYYYDGPHGITRSDGFIFTPEKFDLVQGASKEQLKWKWPSLLSVDWSITAIAGRTDEYVVDLFFRKRRFGHRPDSVGRSRLSSAMFLLNPFSLRIPTERSVVAECVFDRQEKCWSIERLRTDKAEPNSVVTVISVLESLVEDVTLEVLIDMLGVADPLLASEVQSLQGDADADAGAEETAAWTSEASVEHRTCQLTLRATQLQTPGEHELHLYWAVRISSEKQHIPCIHCKVSECAGLGFACPVEDKTSRLTENLYIALANAGGSCAWSDFTVDAVFDGDAGRWNIVSLHPTGENRKSTSVGVIEHLQCLLVHGRETARAVMAFADEQQTYGATNAPTMGLLEKTNNHYACKTRELSTGKDRSALRLFNNWVKNILISNAVAYLQMQRGRDAKGDGLAVADLCSGRGGDLFKWRAHKPRYLFMVDSCLEAVAESAARYSVSKGLSVKVAPQEKSNPGAFAYFTVCDVFDETGSLAAKFENFFNAYLKERRFDIVSCQFSLHYGCSTEERMNCFLRAVSAALRPGGVFIGTTVSDVELRRRLAEHGPVFGNSVYTVRFPAEASPGQSFGVQYSVSVESSVSELPEYLVPWERLVALCGPLGLQLVESLGFMAYRELHYNTPKGQELRDVAVGGGKRDSDGHASLPLSSEEMEAASLFRTFFFVKS
ncbi:putative methyltransferase, putative,mRNA cap methyltransferase-like protein [Trypanosoma conorhini]|uniref:Putative methyltransferase, putative,mRNA cap methyltransferase-like protein n=1 Tax=Trypanosoma conorhini TaxID=83891 RepID=A0A3R7KN08_9TRYP|nr:putative methyltransferase, putative,mRNA cap methyltransferase-like protein [Trypanosoma conorhini]RNF10650.1 putative methyltransferase, putative,mRNA cap methyltransferase-like protein [Trypanosoma conorhini]